MHTPAAELVNAQMESVKNLYAEFFMLMLQSVEEEPGEQPGGIDDAIEGLMGTIDERMREFRERVTRARGEKLLPHALDAEVTEFTASLGDGLREMARRVEQRQAALEVRFNEIKDRLKLIQRKKTGARGYRHSAESARLLESRI